MPLESFRPYDVRLGWSSLGNSGAGLLGVTAAASWAHEPQLLPGLYLPAEACCLHHALRWLGGGLSTLHLLHLGMTQLPALVT